MSYSKKLKMTTGRNDGNMGVITMHTEDFNGFANFVLIGRNVLTRKKQCIIKRFTPFFYVTCNTFPKFTLEKVFKRKCTGDCGSLKHSNKDMPQLNESVYGNDYRPHSFVCEDEASCKINIEKMNHDMRNFDGYDLLHSYNLYKVSAQDIATIIEAAKVMGKNDKYVVHNGRYKPLDYAKRCFPRARCMEICDKDGNFYENFDELNTSWSSIPSLVKEPITFPKDFFFEVLVFDIETCTTSGKSMHPKVVNGDIITQIGVSKLKTYPYSGKNVNGYVTVLCNGETGDGEDWIQCFKNETEMLKEFAEKYVYTCDFISGWNSDNYDIRWILQRMELSGLTSLMTKVFNRATEFPNKMLQHKPRVWNAKFRSEAKVMDEKRYSHMRGIVPLDAMKCIKDSYPKLTKFTLDYVAKEFLHGDSKADLPYVDGYEHWKSGDPKRRLILAEYCRQDVDLTQRIITDKLVIQSFMSHVSLFRLPPSYCIWKGISSKTPHLIRLFAGDKMVEPTYKRDPDIGVAISPHLQTPRKKMIVDKITGKTSYEIDKKYSSFKGGMVIVPKRYHSIGKTSKYPGQKNNKPIPEKLKKHMRGEIKLSKAMVLKLKEENMGFVSNRPMVCLDFASLYPAEIRSLNVCQTTAIRKTTWEGSKPIKSLTFVQDREGVNPKVVRVLTDERNREKKLRFTDPERRDVHEANQISIKIATNATYGLLGASTADNPAKDLAAYVTKSGRNSLMAVIDFVQTKYPGAIVCYGDTDSIFVLIDGKTENLNIIDMIKFGMKVSKEVQSILISPMELEAEKVIAPNALFVRKKRYSGREYTWSIDKETGEPIISKGKWSAHGHELVRKANSIFCRETQRMMLTMLNDGEIWVAFQYVTVQIKKLLMGELPLSDYIIYAGYKKDKSAIGSKLPAAEVVKKMVGDKNCLVPQIGDSVPLMVYGQPMKKRKLNSQKVAEHVISDIQAKHDTDSYFPDMNYYFNKQLVNKLLPILTIYIRDGLVSKKDVDNLFKRENYDEVKYFNPNTSIFTKSLAKNAKRTIGGHCIASIRKRVKTV